MNRRSQPFSSGSRQDATEKRRARDAAEYNRTGFITGYLADRGVRETIESVVVAVMLALLFRAFEAEAFVIPTGSMAPTLMGRHKDVECLKCGYRYQAGASDENEDRPPSERGLIGETHCPICRYPMVLDPDEDPNEGTFDGDRILVDKFAYEFGEPERWDVIVFKYPGNPKQNYIKRLIGLPNEVIRVRNGDIYAAAVGSDDFRIQSKDHRKLTAMLQAVDDTHYIADELKAAEWPSRWQEWSKPEEERAWTIDNSGEIPVFLGTAENGEEHWLRYRHLVPNFLEWDLFISKGELPFRLKDFQGELIADYYAYNDTIATENLDTFRRLRTEERAEALESEFSEAEYNAYFEALMNDGFRGARDGMHWVGDLAAEFDVEVKSETGFLMLDLVEGGIHFTCTIHLDDGKAEITASDPRVSFVDHDGNEVNALEATTSVQGSGSYRLKFANCDDRMYLWIDNRPVELNGSGRYQRTGDALPQWSAEDPGDAEPVGIGIQSADVAVSRCRVWRDIYYTQASQYGIDYTVQRLTMPDGSTMQLDVAKIREILQSPQLWNETARPLFESLLDGNLVFKLGDEQYFPMGDNSPASADARSWSYKDHYVEGEALVGKALFVYWPHVWNRPIPYFPNFRRMGFIR